MTAETPASNTEAELERFREEWRQEVNRSRTGGPASSAIHRGKVERRKDVEPPPAQVTAPPRRKVVDYSEEVEPRSYHDLPDKEEQSRLGGHEQPSRSIDEEPSSALEHYEKAVEKETQGQLGASIRHYRKAFKLDDGVHEAYKKKHFPPSSFSKQKTENTNPSNASTTVPSTAHHSLHGGISGALSSSLKQMTEDFSGFRIGAAPPPTNVSPQQPCLLAELPEEILGQILTSLATVDVTSFARMARVCKRLAYLVLTEDSIWKQVAVGEAFGFAAMHYDYACDIEGFSLEANDEIARYLGSYDAPTGGESEQHHHHHRQTPAEERAAAFSALTDRLLHTTYASSWRQMFRSRPRIRFNGCYISTVNYARPGATSTNTLIWGSAPVHMVTYFRYLRFFRDGTVISLLTTNEPADVVHHLTKENLHAHHGNNTLPSSVMKDALRGRWRLSGPISSGPDAASGEPEAEGDLHVETEGVVAKYTYKMLLALAHAGKGARNNKLAWKGFWSYNRLTDDWAEFGLRNDRAFYWSRVRSFGAGY